MKEYKKIFKCFVAGQEEEECEWLSKMSKSGYHLQNISFASYYTFKKGEPKDYTYMIDMKEKDQDDEGEYIGMYGDHNIEFIDKSASFYYFRGDSNSEVVSLMNSEKGRYLNRINSHKKIIAIGGLLNIIIFIFNFINCLKTDSTVLTFTSSINLLVGLFCIWVCLLIGKKEIKLKEDGVKSPYKTNIKDWPKLYYLAIVITALIIMYGVILLFSLYLS
ncbi:DUF2812 domain-containing protein [Romboutsia sp.]|uniref:DUF2812 domain-containing protein n=1 Tax=Romboutsia sp. TaxID=1965302 RepID=UPI003F2D2ACD